MNRVPEPAPAAEAARDPAEAAGYPPAAGPEARVLLLRPAMFRARPAAFSGLMLLLAACVAGVIAGLVYERPWLVTLPSAVVLFAGAVVLGVWFIETRSAALEVTNKRTIERRGLLSRSTSEVLHENIRNLQIKQTFWQRVWRVGELAIASAGQGGIEIHMTDIPNPRDVRHVIDLYRPL